MHAQTLIVSLLAGLAVATPLVERAVVTEYNYVTDVVTVTADARPTPESYPHGGHRHRGHRHRGRKHRPSKRPVETATQEPVVEPSIYEPPKQGRPSRTKKVQKPEPTTYEPPSSGQPSGSYADKCLKHHNAHRANHSAPALEWSDSLASTAQKIAETCVYAHNTDMDNGGYGQNIAAGIPADKVGNAITDAFYNGEVDLYEAFYGSEPDMSDFSSWGHFSQIVWVDTAEVGCATVHCDGGLSGTSGYVSPDFTVCNYKSPGNFGGEYSKNVLRSKGMPSIYGEDNL